MGKIHFCFLWSSISMLTALNCVECSCKPAEGNADLRYWELLFTGGSITCCMTQSEIICLWPFPQTLQMVTFCSIPLAPHYYQWCQIQVPGLHICDHHWRFYPIFHANMSSPFKLTGPLLQRRTILIHSWWRAGGQAGETNILLTCSHSHVWTQRWEKPFLSWGIAGLSAVLSDSSFGCYKGVQPTKATAALW